MTKSNNNPRLIIPRGPQQTEVVTPKHLSGVIGQIDINDTYSEQFNAIETDLDALYGRMEVNESLAEKNKKNIQALHKYNIRLRKRIKKQNIVLWIMGCYLVGQVLGNLFHWIF